MFLVLSRTGFGRHLSTLARDEKTLSLRTFWLAQMTYKVSLQLTKVSLLMFYMRIFHHIRWFNRLSIGVIVALTVYLVATTVTSIAQCTPVARAWDTSIPGSCIQLNSFFIFNGTVALATDIIVLFLPLPLIWGLQIPLGQKLALVPVFGLGIFIVIVSTLRLYALIATLSSDVTFDLWGTVWTIVEYNLAIVCASLPSVRVLLVRLFPNAFPSSSRHRSGVSGGGVGRSGAGAGASWNTRSSSNGWSRVEASKPRRDETSSEEIILESYGGIKKTVQYDVEFGSIKP